MHVCCVYCIALYIPLSFLTPPPAIMMIVPVPCSKNVSPAVWCYISMLVAEASYQVLIVKRDDWELWKHMPAFQIQLIYSICVLCSLLQTRNTIVNTQMCITNPVYHWIHLITIWRTILLTYQGDLFFIFYVSYNAQWLVLMYKKKM